MSDRVLIPHAGVSDAYIESETSRLRQKLRANYIKFMGDKKPVNLENKILIVVDDGIATGNTLMSTIQILRNSNPAKIIVAVPVAPQSAVNKLSKVVDELVIPLIPQEFYGVGSFYEDFTQVSDEDVIHYLNEINNNHIKYSSPSD